MTEDIGAELGNGRTLEQAGWFHGTVQHAAHTVLLVEDEPFVRGVVSEVLRSAGYDVLIATDGSEAWRLYESCSGALDLLVSDLVLPGEDGHALAMRLRRNNPHLKVLLMSGYADRVAVSNVRDRHEYEWLAKPFPGERLLEKIRRLLDPAPLRPIPDRTFKCACENAWPAESGLGSA